MDITRSAPATTTMTTSTTTSTTTKGPAEWFTGDVWIDPVVAPHPPSKVQANLVHFMPGARTAWHRHPLGQSLFVTEGVGLVQRREGPVEVIRPGDRVWIEPDGEHWYGATATIAIIGAGPGLGAATARRFAREGFDVALLARDQDRLDALAHELGSDTDTQVMGFPTDARDASALTAALQSVEDRLGPVDVLQYSPVPQAGFMRPVTDTTPTDLLGPVEMSIYGPVAAVQQVLPGMRARGRGTLLFVNGGSAVDPKPDYAGTSIAFAGESAYAQMLHDALTDDGITVAQLIIPGAITPGHPTHDPDAIADVLHGLHQQPGEFRHRLEDPS